PFGMSRNRAPPGRWMAWWHSRSGRTSSGTGTTLGGGWQQHRRNAEEISSAHAERLVSQFADQPHAVSFLVRGFRVVGPVTGPWTPAFPGGEVDDSVYNIDAVHRLFHLRMPSAFRLLVRVGDYHGAREICLRSPSAFTSPGLRGWRFG